jgi:hypothetical protein
VDPRVLTDEIFKREYPSREEFERDLAVMVDRGMYLLYIFSGESNYVYPGQFWDWLRRKDWGGRIRVEYRPRANHTFTFREERDAMLALVVGWIRSLSIVRSDACRALGSRPGPSAAE